MQHTQHSRAWVEGAHEQCAPRPAGWFKRSMVLLMAVSIINTLGLPLVHAQMAQRSQQAAAQHTGPAEQYAQTLEQLHALLEPGADSMARMAAPQLPEVETLQRHADELAQEWQTLRSNWQAAGVDSGILDHQIEQERAFAARHQELLARLSAVKAGGVGNAAALQALKDFLDAEKPARTHLPIDLNNMPWQVETASNEAPATTVAELELKAGLSPFAAGAPAEPAGRFKATPAPAAPTAPTAPTAVDLAETVDAPQTADIKALAQTLGHNPHQIYRWVHDNIHYVPTHGSVQGAQDTLDKKAGNAFDTASLLIALLRASGIPARYVYGSVEIPTANALNWVGGAKTADAAQQIWGQGGVPNIALVSGGQIKALRIEHVWVESLIQYQPGRGARHVPGQSTADTWVPMDASYKQYTFTQGMDLQQAVPLDAQALIDAASQGVETNEGEGWVRGINSAGLEQQLKAYQSQLAAHIQSQNAGNSTVGDVLGTRTAKIDPLPYLAGTLPYTIKARTQQFSEVPDSRRAQFKYEIYADQRSAAWGDSPLLSWQAPTAAIAGKKVTLAWVAASEADQKAIDALIPTPKPGQELDPSQLPRGLSSSIRLKAEMRVDGTTVATGAAMSAGSEPLGMGGFTRYGRAEWDTTQDQLIAGQQTALGISIQGISQKQLDTLKTRMEKTGQTLQQAQAAPASQRAAILEGMTGEQLTGDMLTATIWGYFASLQSHGVIASAQAQMYDRPALTYGLFHAQARPNKIFGIVTTGITFQGLNMDIGHLRHVRWVLDDDPQSGINSKPDLTENGKPASQNRWIAYNKMRGQFSSAMEHAVPERYWVDKSRCRYTDESGVVKNPGQAGCAEGISAVKALAIAQQQGQKVYTINQSNRDTALPKLSIGGEMGAEIRSAIQAGKEVIFHENRITANGWAGYGYVITDQETGAGGYIIEGRGNGGFLDWWDENGNNVGMALTVTSLVAAAFPLLVSAPLLWGLFFISVFVSVMNYLVNDLKAIENGCPSMGYLALGIEAVALLFGVFKAAGLAIGSYISLVTGGAVGTAVRVCSR